MGRGHIPDVPHAVVTGDPKAVEFAKAPIKPEGWDPRARPVRHCPLFKRPVHVDEACPKFCGIQYREECKYADSDPTPGSMGVVTPIVVAEPMDADEFMRRRKENR